MNIDEMARECAEKITDDFSIYAEDEEIHRLEDIIKQALRSVMPRWMPIETAPKDGTVILIMKDNTKIASACWSETLNDGSWSFTATFQTMKPTHWQPLPPLPSEESDD